MNSTEIFESVHVMTYNLKINKCALKIFARVLQNNSFLDINQPNFTIKTTTTTQL